MYDETSGLVDITVRGHEKERTMKQAILLVVFLVSFVPTAFGAGLDDWVTGNEFEEYSLLAMKNAGGNYFAIFQNREGVIVASRELVEIFSTGAHEMQFELIDETGSY